MSASEKLKELATGLNVEDGVAAGLHLQAAVLTVQRMLPQIVAVVEVGELYAEVLEDAHLMKTALAALEKELSE